MSTRLYNNSKRLAILVISVGIACLCTGSLWGMIRLNAIYQAAGKCSQESDKACEQRLEQTTQHNYGPLVLVWGGIITTTGGGLLLARAKGWFGKKPQA